MYEENTSILSLSLRAEPEHKAAKIELRRWTIAIFATLIIFGVFHPVWSYGNGALYLVVILLFGLISVSKGLMATTQ